MQFYVAILFLKIIKHLKRKTRFFYVYDYKLQLVRGFCLNPAASLLTPLSAVTWNERQFSKDNWAPRTSRSRVTPEHSAVTNQQRTAICGHLYTCVSPERRYLRFLVAVGISTKRWGMI